MRTYLALLRGVNVGGKSLLKMSDLKDELTKAGLINVRTYIQSGNIIFSSDIKDDNKLVKLIESVIENKFSVAARVVVFSYGEWQSIVQDAPAWWGKDKTWKHNLIILMPPYDMQEAIEAVGALKPEIESIEPGKGVLYQSMSFQRFGQTTSSKLITKPIYKRLTIRNYNTATKLLSLLDD